MTFQYVLRFIVLSLSLFWAGALSAQTAGVQAAYVVLGPDRASVARVITAAPDCPSIRIDGRRYPMQVRARAGTEALRPTQSTPDQSKASVFDVTTCEANLPPGTRSAVVDGQVLPVRKARIDRIVVIGDTGCRLKAADNAYQACNDPAVYPFGRVAAQAAAWKPDAVVHVGDYEYRENPCPDGNTGCAGSPWGYGWDAWNADFFAPGAPLLRAAPLILARGNHENCSRAGQGWWRFLDPRPMELNRDCNDPAHDVQGDYSDPYPVDFGGGAQIVVMDLSHAGGKVLTADDPLYAQYQATYGDLARWATPERYTFTVDHYPILGVSAKETAGPVTLTAGNTAIQSAFGAKDPLILPKGVDVLLAGHVHLWEQVSFSSPHPTQFIAGFSGTLEDTVPLPASLPDGLSPAAGAIIDRFSSWVDGFGYMTLERLGARRWAVKVWDLKGHVVNRCTITGRRSVCDVASMKGR